MNEMLINNEPIQVQKKSYAAPVIIDSGGMTFTEVIWNDTGTGCQYQCFHCNCSNN